MSNSDRACTANASRVTGLVSVVGALSWGPPVAGTFDAKVAWLPEESVEALESSDCTGQQILDAAVVLINGKRVGSHFSAGGAGRPRECFLNALARKNSISAQETETLPRANGFNGRSTSLAVDHFDLENDLDIPT